MKAFTKKKKKKSLRLFFPVDSHEKKKNQTAYGKQLNVMLKTEIQQNGRNIFHCFIVDPNFSHFDLSAFFQVDTHIKTCTRLQNYTI